ncbi:MAG: polysaccharide deacetylase family protein [Armatimonadetes bacterium]|nr:polysaccharide deacetylase family protein [Armatimonadota bacterium]
MNTKSNHHPGLRVLKFLLILALILPATISVALVVRLSPNASCAVPEPADLQAVALTFDDGPSDPGTARILDILSHYRVHATFFVVGARARQHPDLIGRMVREGHDLGNHTYSHPRQKLTAAQLRHQILKTDRLLHGLTGIHFRLFRPSAHWRDKEVLPTSYQLGYPVILASVIPRDWERPGVEVIVKRIAGETQAGSVILLHDGGQGSRTVDALDEIITDLLRRRYVFRTISEMIRDKRMLPASEVRKWLPPYRRNARPSGSRVTLFVPHKDFSDRGRTVQRTS